MFAEAIQMKYPGFLEKLLSICPQTSFDEPMSKHTTFRVGGPAAVVTTPGDQSALIQILRARYELAPDLPLCIIGKGSNVLFDDEGYDGLVVFTSELQSVDYSPPDENNTVTVYAECGVSLTLLARQCGSEMISLDGLTFAYGIPGTIGGAIVMNAGAYGGEISDVTVAVDYFDLFNGEIKTAFDQELDFSYRHSLFSDHPEFVVLGATLRLSPGVSYDLTDRMATIMTSRRLKQPLDMPNAGSVFKRPKDTFAGKLIEESGLKGFHIGGAQVSEKHAGFIVNTGSATARDIKALISHIEHVVRINFGITLEREIRYITADSMTNS